MRPEISTKAIIAADQASGELKAAGWPPVDPKDYTTKTDFTVSWAKKLRGFKTLADLQRAAGSKGTISEIHLEGENQSVSFHWRSEPKNSSRLGYMLAVVRPDGSIGVGVLTDENIEVVVNTFGGFICDKCDPPIEIIGSEPTWK
jgi:hypothetical protein